MNKKINLLLKYVFQYNASDVHFTLVDKKLVIRMRGLDKMIPIQDKKLDVSLFHYLKFISNLDLGNSLLPQSGNFKYRYKNRDLSFRFSFLRTLQTQSGVLRILNNHAPILIDYLSHDPIQNQIFYAWTKFRSGLALITGPTGSGKSTTLHAILNEISDGNRLHVITLEDPIEIQSNTYLQLQINEKMNFGYAEGIKQLLRHDPDVIMIGEVRDETTAKMLIRCALSGHMVFTTMHAKNAKEAIHRLLEFGVSERDIQETLTGVTNQRIFKKKDEEQRICIYEILQKEDLKAVVHNQQLPTTYEDITIKIKKAVAAGWIDQEAAQSDIETETL